MTENLKNPRNPVGMLHDSHRRDLLQQLLRAPYIRPADKVKLGELLG